MNISVRSKQFYSWIVEIPDPNGGNIDPTGTAPSFAFLPSGSEPDGTETWTAGVWDEGGAGYVAQILIGPSAHVVALGNWAVFVKATAGSQVVVQPAGTLVIY